MIHFDELALLVHLRGPKHTVSLSQPGRLEAYYPRWTRGLRFLPCLHAATQLQRKRLRRSLGARRSCGACPTAFNTAPMRLLG